MWSLAPGGVLGFTATQVSGFSNVTAIAATGPNLFGGNFYALKSDGTVWGIGNSMYGQLGFTNYTTNTNPVQLSSFTNIVNISAGEYYVYGVKSDGTVVGKGFNSSYQRNLTSLTGVRKISAAYSYAYALKNDGTVWSVGENSFGQLGNGNTTNQSSPVQVSGLTGVVDIFTRDSLNAGYALKSDGTVWAWGYNNPGTLGDGTNTDSSVPVQVHGGLVLSSFTANTTNPTIGIEVPNVAYTIKPDGTVWGWGTDSGGYFGDGTTSTYTTPSQVSGISNITKIEGWPSQYGSLALKSDGTVWAWGDNSSGQLGDGTTTSQQTPVQVVDLLDGSGFLTGVIDVAGGAGASFAVKTDGTVWAWGFNGYGQLGDGTTNNSLVPIQNTNISNVAKIAGGLTSVHALKTDGTVWSWGIGDCGELGNATGGDLGCPQGIASSTVPVQVHGAGDVGFLTDIIDITAGPSSVYALKSDGTVWAWGANGAWQLGDGTNVHRNVPVQVSGLTSVSRIGSGYTGGFAVKSDGTLWGWGYNSYGELGDGTTTYRDTPVQIHGENDVGYLTNIVAVKGGVTTSHAIDSNGTVWSWGWGGSGALGNNTTATSYTPVKVITATTPQYLNLGTAAYQSSGTFTSAVIDLGEAVTPSTVAYSVTLNAQTFTLDMRAGDTATPDGSWTAWQTSIASGGSISGLSSHRYFQYRANFSTTDTLVTPVLNSVTISYNTSYPTTGDLTSNVYNTEDATNHISSLSWTETGTTTTETIKFQVRTSPDNTTWTNWCGMADTGTTCTGTNYFTYADNGVTIPATNPIRSGANDQYLQYRTVLTSGSSETHYPLDDDGSVASTFGIGYAPAATSSAYQSITYTLTGTSVWPSFRVMTSPASPFTAPALTTFTGKKAVGFTVPQMPATANDTVYAILIGFNGAVGNIFQFEIRGDGQVTGRSGPTVSPGLSTDFSTTTIDIPNSTFGMVADGDADIVHYYINGALVGSSTYPINTPTGFVVYQFANDTSVSVGSTIQATIVSDAAALASYGFDAGTTDLAGNLIGGSVSSTPSLTSLSVNYATNEPPAFNPDYPTTGTGGITASQNNDGTVTIDYSLRDIDTLSASTTPGYITPSFEYSLDGGSSWGSIASGNLTPSSLTNKTVDEATYSHHSATWYVASSTPGVATSTAQIRITADDNEVAHSTTTATTANFALDTTGPTVSSLDAPPGSRTATSAVITFNTNESAVGYVEYSTQDDDDYHLVSTPSASGTGHSITLSSLPTDTVYVYRAYAVDAYGNTGTAVQGGTFTLGTPALLSFTDDGIPSTTSLLAVSGGDFDLGTYASTEVLGTGLAESLSLTSTAGAFTPKVVGHSIISGGTPDGSGYAITDDGYVYSWGGNLYGELGQGTTSTSSAPALIATSTLNHVVDITTGGDGLFVPGQPSAYALTSGGHVYAWGANSNGQLGLGDTTDHSTPTQITALDNITAIASSWNTAYAVRTVGATTTVYAWGVNDHGQLGTGDTVSTSTPVLVQGLNNTSPIVAVAAVLGAAYALESNGTVWSWGWNIVGQLGDGGLVAESYTPIQLGLTGIQEISGGFGHVLARKDASTVYAWGYDNQGEVGNGTTAFGVASPYLIPGLSDVARVAAAGENSYVVTSTGAVYGWGGNPYGSLGGLSDQSSPALLADLTDVRSVGGGFGYVYALKNNGSVYSMGLNNVGQLGNGDEPNATSTPSLVSVPSLGGVPVYAASGTFISNVIDLAGEALFTTLTYNTTLNGQNISVDVRAGDNPSLTGGAWTTGILNHGDISSLTATSSHRYFQYRVHFTGDTTTSPLFNQLTVFYTQYTTDTTPTTTPTTTTSGGGSILVTLTPPTQPQPVSTSTPPTPEVPETPVILEAPQDLSVLPPVIAEPVVEQRAQEAAQFADEHPVQNFLRNLVGGDGVRSVPTLTSWLGENTVKGITAFTTLPGIKQTLDASRKVIEDPLGNIITKTVATAGVAGGTALAVTSLFLNPLTIAEIFLLPARIFAALLSALGIKKRSRRWGTVYDSVTKQPLDPAYVVLKDADGKEVATSITDLDGRYGFLIGPGTYTIEVNKTNYTFPSTKLANQSKDILYDDLYFGESFTLLESSPLITKNIPLDPTTFDWNEFTKQDKSLTTFVAAKETRFQTIATYALYLGLPVAIIGVIIAPAPYNAIIMGAYIILGALRFLGFKPKAHGTLKDNQGNPLSYAIVRVHDMNQGGKEIFHRVADAAGRYYCLVQKGTYTITVEQKNPDETYTLVYTSPSITTEKGVIRENVTL